MGLYFRKSVSLGHGLRLNFSKSGVGLSGGVKGFRVSTGPRGTRVTTSIPGTGIYYTEKIDSTPRGIVWGNGTNRQSTRNVLPYERTVTNQYTGESRVVRAATSWELESLTQSEEQRQSYNEQLQRNKEHITSQQELASKMTHEAVDARKRLLNLIEDTLQVDDRLDWDAQLMSSSYPEFNYDEEKPKVPEVKKQFGFKALFSKHDNSAQIEYERKYAEYMQRKEKAFEAYSQEKADYEKTVRAHNSEILFLKESFEVSESSAVERYASAILSKSQYPESLDLDFDVKYLRRKKILEVDCLLPPFEELPIQRYYIYNSGSSEIVPTELYRSEIRGLYELVVTSVALRTVHELYEAIYTNSVDNICFNGFILNEGIEEINSDDFESSTHCILSTSVDRKTFETLDLRSASPKVILDRYELSVIPDILDKSTAVSPRRI